MDDLGQRLINDRAAVIQRRQLADELEQEAKKLRREADEIERLSELSRLPRF
jgi:hypothetical protein